VLEEEDADDSPPLTSGSIKLFEADGVLEARLGRRRFHGEVDLPSAERKRNASRSRVEGNMGVEIIVFVSFICKAGWLVGWLVG
jgi:hypothetical protein